MKVINNVFVEQLDTTLERLKTDPHSRKTKHKLGGEWNLDSSKAQFVAVLKTDKVEMIKLEADQPIAQGGKGIAPSPIHYCLLGIASCFAATLVTTATLEGNIIKKLKVDVEAEMNSSRIFGLTEEPIIEKVSLLIEVELENGGRDRVLRLIRLAEERCPAAYTLTRGTNLQVRLAQN